MRYNETQIYSNRISKRSNCNQDCSDDDGQDSDYDYGKNEVVDLVNALPYDVLVLVPGGSFLVVYCTGPPHHHKVGGHNVPGKVKWHQSTWGRRTCKCGQRPYFLWWSTWHGWGPRWRESPGRKSSSSPLRPRNPQWGQRSSRLGPSWLRKRLSSRWYTGQTHSTWTWMLSMINCVLNLTTPVHNPPDKQVLVPPEPLRVGGDVAGQDGGDRHVGDCYQEQPGRGQAQHPSLLQRPEVGYLKCLL